jgi:hypothetical protein
LDTQDFTGEPEKAPFLYAPVGTAPRLYNTCF